MKIFRHLYTQVLIGIFIGVILGIFAPSIAVTLKPLADVFIKLIKLMIAPIIFLTLVSGIAAMKDLKAVGKIGGVALLYFFTTTVVALTIGMVVANIFKPGVGLNINPNSLDINNAKAYMGNVEHVEGLKGFLMNIIPNSFVGAFSNGDILQVLFVSILFASGLILYGDKGQPILESIQSLSKVFFKMIHIVMYYSPLAAFAAMGYTVGMYGASALLGLLGLLLCFYLTCLLFLLVFLGLVLRLYCKISIFRLLNYIKTEIFIVLGTSSSESVLPNLMEKLEQVGCDRSIVSLVVPTGYSFNLDGTAIYLSLAAIFIAQALGVDLTLQQQIFMLMIMIISSKGAAGVTGSGFIILATTLSALGVVPVAGIVIILGIDRFMSEGRSITNMIGNAVGTIIISKSQGKLDVNQARLALKY
ncbi:aerobic C4-dicarboxylate transport protein [Allofrancisella inopinata]|uniref:C4-dicarboxylate transporter DctA n=1 Tax=Allofrancisella inopinata TaxID=1085647 RepID=A0AAE7CQW9_9GAMM|nr:C4-dicarboxylate transporter DctA [Allofrancisella inopinata]QIV96316.1 C4-dicarboxylate transporter DctA [Allofrancisella inopinata]TDT74594.1 aerobic C4-dicarboxylate transport protein [Allofrancisella inopinata]